MRVTILGASRFGAAIADQLIDGGHEVILIDKERARLERQAEHLDCGMIEGDGTMPTVLREAFQNEDDIFIAMTNASDDNILASIVARSVGFGRVIPQITAAELMDVCHELELNDVINPHATVADSICASLEGDTEIEYENVLRNQLALKRISIPARLDGKTLGEVDLPDKVTPVAHIRDEDESFAAPDTTLKEGDGLLFASDRDAIDALVDLFAD